jgi:hypothetical protein
LRFGEGTRRFFLGGVRWQPAVARRRPSHAPLRRRRQRTQRLGPQPAPHSPSRPSPPPQKNSRAEDLPGCSGAGLFESHATAPLRRELADYGADALCRDEASALRALWAAALAAAAAERALAPGGGGGAAAAQDVEGAIDWDGNVWVLQSRAQA